jgi:hypothetical protein
MYTRATSLPNLYIRNIIPDDMGVPFWSTWAYRGGVMRYSPECVEWAFSEVYLRHYAQPRAYVAGFLM